MGGKLSVPSLTAWSELWKLTPSFHRDLTYIHVSFVDFFFQFPFILRDLELRHIP